MDKSGPIRNQFKTNLNISSKFEQFYTCFDKSRIFLIIKSRPDEKNIKLTLLPKLTQKLLQLPGQRQRFQSEFWYISHTDQLLPKKE